MAPIFTGPPSAVIVNGDTQTPPAPGPGNLATITAKMDAVKVTANLLYAPLPDRAETFFESVPLFVVNGKGTTDERYDKIVALYYLNWQLRQLAIKENNRRVAPENPRKRAASDYDTDMLFSEHESVDATVASVASAISYIGYHTAGMGNSVDRTGGKRVGHYRGVASQLQGTVYFVPNVFVRQTDSSSDGRLDDGDLVGFMIKRIPWHMAPTSWKGEPTNGDTRGHPTDVIQIVPVAGTYGAMPKGGGPNGGDTYDYRYVKDDNVPGPGKRFKITVPAIFIPVGRIKRVMPDDPSRDTKYHASFAYIGYEKMLTRNQTVDIELGVRHPTPWGI